jgi:polyhydroxyalkanoate synthase
VTVLGSPIDVSQVPLVAPLRPLLNLADGRVLTPFYRLLGGAPKPVVTWAFQLTSFQKLVTRPLAVATRLDDTDFLAQLEAVDRFTSKMTAYPGRSFGQLYHRFVRSNVLSTGRYELADRTVDLAAIKVAVLVVAGATDGIAPVNAVKAVVPLLTGSPEVRFEIVPGGHLGLLTGRAARGSTWQVLDEWVGRWSAGSAGSAEPVGKAGPRKAAPRTSAPRRPAARSSAGRTREETPPSTDTIGSNPSRRYGSAASRNLAP